MPIELITTSYGRPASATLHEVVADAKADDPLAPVSIVVPTNYVGVATRRMLAEGREGDVTTAGSGIVGISLLTLYRVAEMLGAPRLAAAHRRPVSTPVIAAAIRTVLTSDAGMFAEVAEHPTTEESLVRAHRELSDLDSGQLDLLAGQSQRAADVVRIHRATRTGLSSDWYDEHDLMDAAVEALGEGSPVLADLGAVVVHLPQRMSQPQARLLRAVSEHAPVTVVTGLTGVERADATVVSTLDRLGVGAPSSGVAPAHGTSLMSVSDADDEVRSAIRLVVEGLRDGVPLERMAVLYGSDEPYARIVHEQLEAAGIIHNGASVRTLRESLVGRTLLGALALPDHAFRRQDVMALVTSAPVRGVDGRPVPSASWERISRRAGVVRGIEEWRHRLDRRISERESRLEAETDPDTEAHRQEHESRVERLTRDIRHTSGLRDFVEHLAAQLDAGQLPPSWADKAAWAHQLLHDLLGDERHRRHWPEHEVDAAEQIERALDRLAGLDELEEAPTLPVFRRTLEMELDAGLGRVGHFGDGLLMGRVPAGLGLELDRVIVLGLAEGTFPARHREDSLLPDLEREATGGALQLRGSRSDDDHRALLAVLAAAGESVLCFPRGDLRRSTERMPSRFWLDTVEALHGGDRLYADDIDGLPASELPWLTQVESFVGGLSRLRFPATVQEYDLRVLLDHTRTGGRLSDHPLASDDAAIAAGLRMVLARRSSRFTRYDGNLGDLPVQGPNVGETVTSPTRLEKWASCPHRYFMETVLGMEEPDDPEERLDIAPVELGNVVHRTLDRFLSEVLDSDDVPSPGEPWSAERRARLHEIAHGTCTEFEEQGLTGRPLLWRGTKRRMLRDLDRFLDEDEQRRAQLRLTPVAAELGFGLADGDEPVVFPLGDGTVLRFRGSADRVDVTDDGAVAVVDYKTGSTRAFKDLDETEPTVRGTKLQLPVYALAAQRAFGDDATPVRADYWFVSSKGEFTLVGYDYSPHVYQEFLVALATITDGISAGVFPAHPDEPTSWKGWISCPWCDPDGLETHDRYREWTRKRLDPAVRVFTELAEPEALPEPGDDDG
ncbi:MAG: PD-(D/E)XK nuclease family protein [Acidimicrobiia bacterium]